jgi:hypothetical protein
VAFNTTDYVSGYFVRDLLVGTAHDLHGTTGGPPFTDVNVIKGALFGNTITNDPDTDATYATYSAGEVAASGTYVAGGKQLHQPQITVVTATNRIHFSDGPLNTQNVLQWTGFTGTPYGGMIWNDTTGDRIIVSAYFDDADGIATTVGTFTWNFDTNNGIFYAAYG